MEYLRDEGYTHCFYVAGGNSMHLLESASRYFECVPTVHEVTAAIAAEYFVASGPTKAFALVTAGPGLTNMITGIAGAWLESHELLVVGGQVKSANLKANGIRQGGIQEIDGIALTRSITKGTLRIQTPIANSEIKETLDLGTTGRKGPIFIEICLDASAAQVSFSIGKPSRVLEHVDHGPSAQISLSDLSRLNQSIKDSFRPIVLLGNGISREDAQHLVGELGKLKIPVATTWSGADRCGFDYPYYAGRPNTFGMRWANIFQQQADLLISIGSSLGLQQTGFNVDEFLPVGKIIQIDIDDAELAKGNPRERIGIKMDSHDFSRVLPVIWNENKKDISEWLDFLEEIKQAVPVLEDCQLSENQYLSPHQVINEVSHQLGVENPVVICSSGGTFTAGMQCFENKSNQVVLANKGLASMGYGMAGAIGVAFQNPNSNTYLFEGDGGFAQNLQDLGTIRANNLPIKMFITSNQGYASIRTSQKNYFKGNYLGCDTSTGLGFPEWASIAKSFGIEYFVLSPESIKSEKFVAALASAEPVFFEIISDPEQMYLPKVASTVETDGSMRSTPIHSMLPPLPPQVAAKVFRFIDAPE